MGLANIVDSGAVSITRLVGLSSETTYLGGEFNYSMRQALVDAAEHPENRGMLNLREGQENNVEAHANTMSKLASFNDELFSRDAMLPGVDRQNISHAQDAGAAGSFALRPADIDIAATRFVETYTRSI